MVIWVHPFQSILVHWFLNCQCSFFQSPVWPLPICLDSMDLTFQVPMQYCFLQHRTLLPSPVTSTTGCCFCFDSIPSFFLISPLISSSISGTYQPGEFIFQCPIFLPFHAVRGVLKARTLVCFPSPVDHSLSELSTMTRPSWVALHGIAHSFIELDKSVFHVIRLVSFLWLWFSVCLPSDGER